ncbi:hypothetical protein [Syntrophothermus lipocalidus]|uniref:Uncharacterized protein n=1 Tax=Syntrophothermus lipocalidus (strain DSM 12680 / TGB-C1) TaxID=643648 RepID=D7CPY7_SYNLT|nr:hypothetical protein [Syntrophothermus lipocalidus]ADI02765.1 conserved hypothetical protein [Syntrophothermus lipocalidus DSM 12680]
MRGIITDEMTAAVLAFIETVGPCPKQAVARAFRMSESDLDKHYSRLRAGGFLRCVKLGGVTFFIPADYGRFDPAEAETRGWVMARLKEAGCVILGPDRVRFPSMDEARVRVFPDRREAEIMIAGQRYFISQKDAKSEKSLTQITRKG